MVLYAFDCPRASSFQGRPGVWYVDKFDVLACTDSWSHLSHLIHIALFPPWAVLAVDPIQVVQLGACNQLPWWLRAPANSSSAFPTHSPACLQRCGSRELTSPCVHIRGSYARAPTWTCGFIGDVARDYEPKAACCCVQGAQ